MNVVAYLITHCSLLQAYELSIDLVYSLVFIMLTTPFGYENTDENYQWSETKQSWVIRVGTVPTTTGLPRLAANTAAKLY